ncbi:MAG: metallophosphoesterase [candidate division Zixibacteria bacterium]|nr:metallophosphoesterase [candidate division Zixibacteria bacterium]
MSFFVIVVVVLSLMYGYVGWRLIVPAAFALPVNILLWLSLAALLVLPFIPVVTRLHSTNGGWSNLIAWVAYLTFGFVTVLFAFVVARDVLMLLMPLAQKLTNLFGSSGGGESLADPERRRMLVNATNLGLLGVTGALTGYGLFEAMRTPKVVRIDIPVADLPPGLHGYTIAQISDVHVSHTIRRSFVQKVVDEVNRLKPDMVALTGDLVDGSVDQLREDVASLALLQAPDGLFFITGNHEYYSGVQQWVDETRRLGFDVLLNEHRVIERSNAKLLLGGVTDYSGGGFRTDHKSDPHRAIEGAPDCHLKILLAHQPVSIYEAEKAGFDYVLSGHTHGGQYFPYHFLVGLFQPYVAGLHQHGNTRIYVSRGAGYWGPQIRIGAPSEITVHRFVRA